MSATVALQMSLPPMSTVTMSGRWAIATSTWRGRSSTETPERASLCTVTGALAVARSRVAMLFTVPFVPVIQETDGQSP